MTNINGTETRYRWVILTLAALTFSLTVAVPGMCMSVLFDEISDDLGLSLAQVGMIWGIGALPGIVMVLVGGAVGDQIGPKRILITVCLLGGMAGVLRGASNSFATLMGTVFLFGLLTSVVPMNIFKTCGLWFSRQQLGLANGVISMGMALGFMVSAMISATVLSPWLGGWRHVLMFYGVIAMLLSVPWYFTRPAPGANVPPARAMSLQSLRATLAHVARIRRIWLMGWAILGIGGCIQGTLGYLPLYLRDMGWAETNADSASASFHLASMLLVIPIALWSDKLGFRRKILLAAASLIATGVGLLSIAEGMTVWGAVIMAGMVRDGFMAVFMTMIIETKGVGAAYAGTATGLVMVFSGLGNVLAPPLGNSLAGLSPSGPFVFWAALAVAGMWGLYATQEESFASLPVAQQSI